MEIDPYTAYGVIYGGVVHIYYLIALLAIGFLNGLLHILLGFLMGNNLRKLKKTRPS